MGEGKVVGFLNIESRVSGHASALLVSHFLIFNGGQEHKRLGMAS